MVRKRQPISLPYPSSIDCEPDATGWSGFGSVWRSKRYDTDSDHQKEQTVSKEIGTATTGGMTEAQVKREPRIDPRDLDDIERRWAMERQIRRRQTCLMKYAGRDFA